MLPPSLLALLAEAQEVAAILETEEATGLTRWMRVTPFRLTSPEASPFSMSAPIESWLSATGWKLDRSLRYHVRCFLISSDYAEESSKEEPNYLQDLVTLKVKTLAELEEVLSQHMPELSVLKDARLVKCPI